MYIPDMNNGILRAAFVTKSIRKGFYRIKVTAYPVPRRLGLFGFHAQTNTYEEQSDGGTETNTRATNL
jgi:hypothetical protein